MSTRRRCPRAAAVLVAAVLAASVSGCSLLGARQEVDEAAARDLLTRAVGLTASGQVDQLCTLSPAEASSCEASLADAGGTIPDGGPQITCAVALPDTGPLRGGHVLVLEGLDGVGDPYVTEFVVYDDGSAVGVLDAVFWGGLSIQSYDEETVTWRSDSSSSLCEAGRLPGP